jgi:hypothetical protein
MWTNANTPVAISQMASKSMPRFLVPAHFIVRLLVAKNASVPWARGLTGVEPSGATPPKAEKKADVAEHPEVFDHVGLLVNGLPGTAELPFT